MTDDKPTELETFQILEEAQKSLKLSIDPEYSKFVRAGLAAGKTVVALHAEWLDKHKPVELSPEMKEYVAFIEGKMKEGKTLQQSVEEWKGVHAPPPPAPGVSAELKPVMSRLEALEALRLAEVKATLSAKVDEVKKVDPTFDDKKFLAPFGDNISAAIGAVTTYMSAVQHFKDTVPELPGAMHIGGPSDATIAHRKELTKKMFGTDDINAIVKGL